MSPKRYFLDAPKEQPGTCFVKNDDYMELSRAHQQLREAAREVLEMTRSDDEEHHAALNRLTAAVEQP